MYIKLLYFGCSTRIRTLTNRTRICCAAITPLNSNACFNGTKVVFFFISTKNENIFFLIFLFLKEPESIQKKLSDRTAFCIIGFSDYFVAFSRRFIIMKMNSAEIRQSTIRMDHNAHNSMCPHSIPMMDTK